MLQTVLRGSLITVLAGFGLSFAGCYSPNIENGGFTCKSDDADQCPDGYHCVDSHCVNDSASGDKPLDGKSDMHALPAARDMVQTPPAKDFSQPPAPDLTSGCGKRGASCKRNSDCCSMICIPGGTCL